MALDCFQKGSSRRGATATLQNGDREERKFLSYLISCFLEPDYTDLLRQKKDAILALMKLPA